MIDLRNKYRLLLFSGLSDLSEAFIYRLNISIVLGWNDVKQRYIRSKIGPFWLTISMAITVVGMGLVFGTLFGSPLYDFLPFLALGMIIWGFVTTTISDACTTFTSSEGIIKQIAHPLHTHIFRMIYRNILVFGHNFVIYPLILLVFLKPLSMTSLLFIPGFFLVVINLIWVSVFLAVVCTRFRDLTQIVSSSIQLLFFVTPIMWQPELMIRKGRAIFVDVNPFYHLIEIVRAPLLGQAPSAENWVVCLLLGILGWGITLTILGRFKNRIAYWI